MKLKGGCHAPLSESSGACLELMSGNTISPLPLPPCLLGQGSAQDEGPTELGKGLLEVFWCGMRLDGCRNLNSRIPEVFMAVTGTAACGWGEGGDPPAVLFIALPFLPGKDPVGSPPPDKFC